MSSLCNSPVKMTKKIINHISHINDRPGSVLIDSKQIAYASLQLQTVFVTQRSRLDNRRCRNKAKHFQRDVVLEAPVLGNCWMDSAVRFSLACMNGHKETWFRNRRCATLRVSIFLRHEICNWILVQCWLRLIAHYVVLLCLVGCFPG